jgi:hypothetical protein
MRPPSPRRWRHRASPVDWPFEASCGRSSLTRFENREADRHVPRHHAVGLTARHVRAARVPGLIAASVWMKSNPGAATFSGAPLRLTIPIDTLCSSEWVTERQHELMTRRRFGRRAGAPSAVAPSILSRARSTRLSRRRWSPGIAPVFQAPESVPLSIVGVGDDQPLGSMMNPDPVARRGSPGSSPRRLVLRRHRRAGRERRPGPQALRRSAAGR